LKLTCLHLKLGYNFGNAITDTRRGQEYPWTMQG